MRVPLLGFANLLTDVSGETVRAVLPSWLLREVHSTTLEFGALYGAWRGFDGVLGAPAVFAGDRGRRHRLAALAG